MNALQKVKLTKELLGLVGALNGGTLKALEKVKTTKRVLELVNLLGSNKAQAENIVETMAQSEPNTLLQDIINGTVNIVDTPTIIDELAAMADSADPDLFEDAVVAAAKQVIIGNGYIILD